MASVALLSDSFPALLSGPIATAVSNVGALTMAFERAGLVPGMDEVGPRRVVAVRVRLISRSSWLFIGLLSIVVDCAPVLVQLPSIAQMNTWHAVEI